MIIIENSRIIISLPEHFTRQETNPDTQQPFVSEAEAQAWEDNFLKLAAQSASEAAAVAAEREAARKKEARREEIMARLADIDRLSSSARAQREALLGDLTWLTTLNAEAGTLRAELSTIPD